MILNNKDTVQSMIDYFEHIKKEIGEDVEIVFESYDHRQFEIMFSRMKDNGKNYIIMREKLWDKLD